jgi:hypothetical protein
MAKITIDLDLITSEMDTLKDEKARLSFELKNVEKEIKKRELQLVTALQQADVKTMDYGVYSFGWKTTKRKAFDQKLFKEKQPDLFNQYYIEKETEKFEFKINK